jgi:hypothetical protein
MAEFTPIATMVKPPSADFGQINSMVQMGRNSIALQREQELLPYDVAAGKAQSEKSQIDTNTARLENIYKHQAASTRDLLKLLNKKDAVTDKDIANHVIETMANAGAPKQAIQQALMDLPKGGSDLDNRAFIAKHATNSLTAESQLSKLFPDATATNVGGAVVPMSSGGPLAYTTPGTQVGPATATTISPQVFTDPVTKNPTIIGGGRAPGSQPVNQGFTFGGQNRNLPSQNAPAQNTISSIANPAQNIAQVNPSANVQVTQQNPNVSDANAGFVRGKDESPEQYNARVAAPKMTYTKSQDQYNNPNSEFGHIPTIKNLNGNIMRYLDDPSVDTGAVTSYLAGKTKMGSLSDKQQELAKALEQRIQRMNSSSDKDAESKAKAYGSITNKKEALKEILRGDNVWVTQQDLFARGNINAGGTGSNPNFVKVDAFNKQFSQLAQNPNLMKYISLVGENPNKVVIKKDDHKAASEYFGKLSDDEKAKLELGRQTMLKLVGG